MKIKLILLLFIPFLVCGCYNYTELEDVSICTAMGFDIKDDMYEVSYMVANSRKTDASTKEGQSQSVVYTGTGKNISEAVNDLTTKMPLIPYISHLETIIISDDVAKNGVLDILDYLLRHPESRKKFELVLTNNVKASDVLKVLSPLSSFPSTNIASNIKSSSTFSSISLELEYNQFVALLLEEGINPILSSVTVIGDIDESGKSESLNQTTMEALVKTSTIGIFKDDKLIKFSNLEEDYGINFLRNKVKEMIITIPCEDNYITVNIENNKSKLDIKFTNDLPIGIINIDSEAVLNEVNCKIDIKDEKNIKKIEDEAKKIIESYVDKAILVTQNEKTDIFGFGTLIHKNYPKKWISLKENWDDNGFINLSFEKNINFKINGTGSLKQTLKEMQ